MSDKGASEERYFAVFGHFYQPPRFNPWTEEVDYDPTAKPYHDWNERVSLECYEANALAVIEDENGLAEELVNNYKYITFSFGPLLLEYLDRKFPKVVEAIREADSEGLSKYRHGNAIAQPYAHIIMPLARREYREAAIDWGIKFFEKFFGREPEGFWLPEDAVDNLTLELLAERGIKFVILGPHQIKSVRLSDGSIRQPTPETIDVHVTYKLLLPSGNTIGAVLYDRWLSGLVAFGDLLKSGELMARRIVERFDNRPGPQLVAIAVDGETFGHHKRGGERELAKAIKYVEREGVNIINLAYYYSIRTPAAAAEVAENTSWSCPHGVERWRSNCGCGSELRPGWSQEWRTPLREAVDLLADTALKTFAEISPQLMRDPAQALRGYSEVLLDRSPATVSKYLDLHVLGTDEESRSRALELVELMRQTLLAQSSDAWFFEDIYRPEPLQAMKHMARALELLRRFGRVDVESEVLDLLAKAKSNRPEIGTGKDIYLNYALPSSVSPAKVASMFGMRLLFESTEPELDYYSYHVILEKVMPFRLGRARGVTGIITLISRVTWRHYHFMFGALYYGWYDVYGGSKTLASTTDYEKFEGTFAEYFSKGMMRDLVDYMSKELKEGFTDLVTVPMDERTRIMLHLVEGAAEDLSRHLDQLYETYVPLMEYLRQMGIEYPIVFRRLAEHYADKIMQQALLSEPLNVAMLTSIASMAVKAGLRPSDQVRDLIVRIALRYLERLSENPMSEDDLTKLAALLDVYFSLGFEESGLAELRRRLLTLRPRLLSLMDNLKTSGMINYYGVVAKALRVKLP